MGVSDPDQPPDDPDLLAAEYVIGLLTSEEMHEVEAEAVATPALAASIMGWQAWLHPMAGAVPPVPPPAEVWRRLKATTGLVRAPSKHDDELGGAPRLGGAGSSGPRAEQPSPSPSPLVPRSGGAVPPEELTDETPNLGVVVHHPYADA